MKSFFPFFLLFLFCGFFSLEAAETDPITRIRIGERCLILQHGAWAENLVALDAGSGVVVVDTWSTPQAAARAHEILAAEFHKPVTHIINTHHHFDHTFGNQSFPGAEIIGQAFCPEDMRADYPTPAAAAQALDAMIASAPPAWREFLAGVRRDISVDLRPTPPTRLVAERETIRLGDLTFCLYHVPGLHTRSNLTIHIPELGLLFTRGDFHQHSLPALEPGADPAVIIASLEAVLSGAGVPRYIVVGHGQPLADPDLRVPLAYMRALQQAVQLAKKSGRPLHAAEIDPLFRSFPQLPAAAQTHRANLQALGVQTAAFAN